MPPTLILVNGNIHTLDPARPRAAALVAENGQIVYAGDTQGALEYRRRGSELVDARGRLVLPGFTDSHIHFTGYAQGLNRANLEGCRSLEEAVARVAQRVRSTPAGAPVLGSGWNHADWAVPELPDKFSLDAVAPANPVILMRKDWHSAWVNSAALALYGLTRETPDPEGGRLEREADGTPSGLVRENAIALLGGGVGKDEAPVPDDLLLRAVSNAHAAGLTGIHNVEGASSLRAWQSLHYRGELRLRVVHSIPDSAIDAALTLGIQAGLGDEWLRVQAVKLFADGSLGSQTAEMREAFRGSERRGMQLTDQPTLLARARAAAGGGLDLWVHAIGDGAISRVLDIFETLRAEGYSRTRMRIEHVQHLDPADLPRFARSGIVASMQPIHQPSDMQMADALLGPARARYAYAWNSLRQAGALLAFGSDSPVERFDPLIGIHAAVTRQNQEGEPSSGWYPQERLSVPAAVEAYTTGATQSVGEGERAGRLAPGRRADLVVLSQDIFEIEPAAILETRVDHTIVDGEQVYCRAD